MKLLLFILISAPAWSLPWSSQMHHVEPVMNEAEKALEETGATCEEEVQVSPMTYISDRPKTEKWRQYYKIPKLITDQMYKVKDVCEEAKRMNAAQGVTKKYALVANKTHFCDVGARACISTFKSISDPCNSFVQDNFQVFHTRTFIGSHRPAGNKLILDEYGNMGPSLLVINLETCTLMPTTAAKKAIKGGMDVKTAAKDSYFYTPPSLDGKKDAKDEYQFKSDDDSVRFKAMKEALTTNIPELKALTGKNDCYVDGKRTLPGIGDLEEVSYGDIKIKGVFGMRKLMDEQYIQLTGKNPYKK